MDRTLCLSEPKADKPSEEWSLRAKCTIFAYKNQFPIFYNMRLPFFKHMGNEIFKLHDLFKSVYS